MKYGLFLSLFLFNLPVNAEVIPDTIHVNESQELPAVYPLAESHFYFHASHPIINAHIVSDINKWTIDKIEEGHYVIKCKVYNRSKTLDFDSTLKIQLTFSEGEPLQLIAPIQVYAKVKIVPFGKAIMNHDDYELNCTETYGFRALWVYPDYVKVRWRIYGAFDMVIELNNERIDGFTGWYDTGDRTKLKSFELYPKEGRLTARVNRINTLHKYTQEGEYIQIALSEAYPDFWEVECGE